MSNKQVEIYAEAMKRQHEEQKDKARKVEQVAVPDQDVQKPTYKSTQISKRLSNSLSKSVSTDDVELLDFELRKTRKFRVNADIPEDWKEELDSLAFRLKVGKYELLTFVIGQFLGKVQRKDNT